MNTPICDFVNKYCESNAIRLHMPGHKGKTALGIEQYDITEIDGADSLYEASGIIQKSEQNASVLFGSETFYSTEGSSHCIRAMLYLISLYAKQQNSKPMVLSAGNVHKSFMSAVALLDLDVDWLPYRENDTYLSCQLNAQQLDEILASCAEKPTALYLTTPDYLGNITDLRPVAEICHKHGVLLAVDNAHGAYLKFLPSSQHPIDLGADICCDSAHKTLPVLTGGAYLHIAEGLSPLFKKQAKNALSLFGSTSPSYLIMQSLDKANLYLNNDLRASLRLVLPKINKLKETLTNKGYTLYGNEPLKLTISAKSYGYTGKELSEVLFNENIVCEFADPDFVVMMLSAEMSDKEIALLLDILLSIPCRSPINEKPPKLHRCQRVMSIREAMLSNNVLIPTLDCIGKVLSSPCVGCPPAVPIVSCGERIDEKAQECFEYYGIEECSVVLEDK